MAKGYWIARVDVHNDEGYKPYTLANPAIFQKFGGRFIVRGGKFTGAEGESRSRNVVIEFPDYETAMACYNSPGIPGQHQGSAAAFGRRSRDYRGL